MAIQYGDILLNDDFEIFATSDGDLSVGDNKEHQIGAIVNADEGNFRKYPTLAARLSRKADGISNSRNIVSDVVEAVGLDGWRIDEMDIQAGQESVEITVERATKITDDTDSLV